MFVVRYVALATLAIWLGGMVLVRARGDLSGPSDLIAAACGAIIMVCLFVMKFVGPPPRAFVVRAGLAFTITALAVYARVYPHSASLTPTSIMTVNVAIGFVLLAWYARE